MPLTRIVRAASGAVPERVIRLRLVEKSEPLFRRDAESPLVRGDERKEVSAPCSYEVLDPLRTSDSGAPATMPL